MTHPSVVLFELYVAQVDDAEGRWDHAIETARRVVAATEQGKVPAVQRAWAITVLAKMVGRRAPREGLVLYETALRLYAEQTTSRRHGDTDLLREVTELALRAGQPEVALRWFDRMPELAAQLAELRGQLRAAQLHGRAP